MDRVVNEFAQMNPGRETGYTPLKPEIPDDPPEPMRRTAGQPTPTPQPPPAEKPPQPQPAPSPQPPPGPSPAEPDQASAAGVDYSTTGAEA